MPQTVRQTALKNCSPAVSRGTHLLCNSDLQRKRGLMAYEDGYADAREYGRDGFFMPTEWNESLRLKYLAGFERGLKVHSARAEPSRATTQTAMLDAITT